MLTEITRSPLLTNATTASFMFPTLTPGQIERIAAQGVLRPIPRGEVLIEGGQRDVPFFVVKAGEIEVIRPSALGDLPNRLGMAMRFPRRVRALVLDHKEDPLG